MFDIHKLNTDKLLEIFPYNLLAAVFNDDLDIILNVSISKFIECYNTNIDEFNQEITELLFIYNKSVRAVSINLDISVSKVYNRKNKIISILYNHRNEYLSVSAHKYNHLYNEYNRIFSLYSNKIKSNPDELNLKDISVDTLELTFKTVNALKRSGIHNILSLSNFSPYELINLKGIGEGKLIEIVYKLKKLYGIELPDKPNLPDKKVMDPVVKKIGLRYKDCYVITKYTNE